MKPGLLLIGAGGVAAVFALALSSREEPLTRPDAAAPDAQTRALLARPDFPNASSGQPMPEDARRALLHAALVSAGVLTGTTPVLGIDALQGWERLITRALASPPAIWTPELRARAAAVLPAIRAALPAARYAAPIAWPDWLAVYLLASPHTRHEVDDLAERILGRSL